MEAFDTIQAGVIPELRHHFLAEGGVIFLILDLDDHGDLPRDDVKDLREEGDAFFGAQQAELLQFSVGFSSTRPVTPQTRSRVSSWKTTSRPSVVRWRSSSMP